MPDVPPLGRFEHLVITAVQRLGDDAYAVPMRTAVSEFTGRPVARGALYITLRRLEEKGLLRSTLGPSLPVRGGRPRRYYLVTARGAAAMEATRAEFSAAFGQRRLAEDGR